MLFDTWGGLLPAAEYRRFSLAPMRAILAAVARSNVPTIVFTKNGGNALDAIVDSGASCVGLDWTVDLRSARARHGDSRRLPGQSRPARAADRPGHRATRSPRISSRKPVPHPATCSILATGSFRRRRPSTSGCWSTASTRRRQAGLMPARLPKRCGRNAAAPRFLKGLTNPETRRPLPVMHIESAICPTPWHVTKIARTAGRNVLNVRPFFSRVATVQQSRHARGRHARHRIAQLRTKLSTARTRNLYRNFVELSRCHTLLMFRLKCAVTNDTYQAFAW